MPSRLPPFVTPAVVDAQRQEEVERRRAARPAAPSDTRSINAALRQTTPEARAMNAEIGRARIDAIKQANQARDAAAAGLRQPIQGPGTPGATTPRPGVVPPQMPPRPGPTVAPPQPAPAAPAAAPEAPPKPGMVDKAKSGLRSLRPGNLATSGLGAAARFGVGAGGLAAVPEVAKTGTDAYAQRLGGQTQTPMGRVLRAAGMENGGQFFDDLHMRTKGAIDDVAHNVTAPLRMLGLPSVGLSGTRTGAAPARGAMDTPVAQATAATPGATLADNDRRIAEIAAQNGGITPAAARTGDPNEVIGTINGKAITRGMSDQLSQQNVVAAQPGAVAALRAPDLGAMQSGFRQASSRSSDINRRFDAMAKQIMDLHGGARFQARGSMATKLLELEKARANALGQDAGQLVDSQGNQVSDLNNQRSAAASLYGTDVGERSALRRDRVLARKAELDAQNDALKARQEMSEAQLEMADQRATELATGPDGKVDTKLKAAMMDAMARNFGGALDGSADSAGAAREGIATAGLGASIVGKQNRGSNTPSSALDNSFGPLEDPTWGQVFDSRSNVGVGDKLRDYVDWIPGVGSAKVRNTPSKRSLRDRDLTEDERQLLIESGLLQE
jgi:hypothetical protein